MQPSISIIINTCTGREENLVRCLTHLQQQSDSDFEVIVIDSGSEGGDERIAPFRDRFKLHYDWRPFDLSVSRSRNRGAEIAKGDFFVLIDSDLLLNPRAIEAYRAYAADPQHAIIGYYGNIEQSYSYSQWFPDTAVHYLDKRMASYRRDRLKPSHYLLYSPNECAWSANFGISRHAYFAIGGFDERFWGWGAEDNQFGLDLIRSGIQLKFAIDVWGEHQFHSRNTDFHRQSFSGKKHVHGQAIPPSTPTPLCDQYAQEATLRQAIFEWYLQRDTQFGPEIQGLIRYPYAEFRTQTGIWSPQLIPSS